MSDHTPPSLPVEIRPDPGPYAPDPLAVLTPDPPPPAPQSRWRMRTRLFAVGEVVLCSSVPTQLAIVVALAMVGIRAGEDGTLSMAYVVAVSLGDSVLLIALMTWLTRLRGESPARLWVGGRPIGREALHGLSLTPAIFALVVVLLLSVRAYAPWLHNVATNPLEALARQGPVEAAVFGLVAIVAGGVREELQRAFLLDRFERHLGGAGVGLFAISLAFGLGHYLQGWDAVITTAAMGAFWGVVYLRRRSAVAPIVCHSAFNSLEILRVAAGGGAG